MKTIGVISPDEFKPVFETYQKLKPFIRIVEFRHLDREYGPLLDESHHLPEYYKNWDSGVESRPFSHILYLDHTYKNLMWLPNRSDLSAPTFEEFVSFLDVRNILTKREVINNCNLQQQ